MRRFRESSVQWAAALAIAISATPTRAHAEITLYDKDGWGFHTQGIVAAHYQMMTGDTDPSTSHGVLVGGKILPVGADDSRDKTITLSRVRSGFIGTQIGFGATRQISENVRVDSLLAVSLYDISSNRGQSLPKNVDFREAWAGVTTPGGTFKFGRMFSIFGSASAPVILLAYRYGVGHPCIASESTIACASVGAGPIYAGFDAQMRYISPRLAGFEFQFAVSDPVAGPGYHMTPLPRFDADLNYEQTFGPAKLRIIGQGFTEQLQRVNTDVTPNVLQKGNFWGAIGSALVDVGGLSVGGGAWTGAGIGTRSIVEAPDAANPVAYDSTYELRLGRGFFGNVAFDYHGTALAVGAGTTFLRPTAVDKDPAKAASLSIITQQKEWHVVFTQKVDALVFSAEYMNWKSQWYYDERQSLNFMGVGAAFNW